jgi:hypothetical protein
LLILALTSEVYYKGLLEDKRLQIKLTGNWETMIGEQDTFLHILEYENYAGFDKATEIIKNSKVSKSMDRSPPGS